ncbi:MAG: DHHA1 domain-containing protein, partial [Alloprevotella tannerae]
NNSPGGSFVIKFEAAGNHLMILPGAPSGFVKEAFNVIANVSSGQPVTKVCYKLDGAAGESDTELPHSSGTEWKTSSPVSGTSFTSLSEGEHKVHFWAKNSTNQTAAAEIAFIKDTIAPIPTLEYPPANAEQAGTVRIMGSVNDAYAGVNKDGTKYIIGKQASVPTPATTGWRVMDKTTPVSWEFTYNLDDFSSNPASHGTEVSGNPGVYDIPVYILTEDTIGNKAVKSFTVRFDSAGDKPVVTILSPQQNQTLGGTVQIFGTAAARLGSPADIGNVYIQFSKNGNFNDTANGNMTFGTSGGGYDADWHKGGDGQLVPGTDGYNGGSNWQISINGNEAFNNPSGQNWNVYFRVRAKNKTTNKYGPWSEPVKIFIDKAYPTIGSPDPLKLVNKSDGLNPINYTPGMWITDGKKLIGSLYDDSGIKTVEISSPELLGNQKYNLSQALANHWIAEDTAHAPASPGAKNYTLQIPLDLSTLNDLRALFNNVKDISVAVHNAIEENDELKKEVEKFMQLRVKELGKELVKIAENRGDIKLLKYVVKDEWAPDLIKDLAFQMSAQLPENLFCVIGSHQGGKPLLTVMISKQLVESKQLNAGQLVREAAKLMKGGGGGAPHFATAGGKDLNGLTAAVDKVVELAGI